MEEKEIKKEKLSYEELNNVCHQLSEQTRSLYKRLEEANLNNAFRRLDYLFAVLGEDKHFSSDFVKKCANEIVDILTIPEQTEEEK